MSQLFSYHNGPTLIDYIYKLCNCLRTVFLTLDLFIVKGESLSRCSLPCTYLLIVRIIYRSSGEPTEILYVMQQISVIIMWLITYLLQRWKRPKTKVWYRMPYCTCLMDFCRPESRRLLETIRSLYLGTCLQTDEKWCNYDRHDEPSIVCHLSRKNRTIFCKTAVNHTSGYLNYASKIVGHDWNHVFCRAGPIKMY